MAKTKRKLTRQEKIERHLNAIEMESLDDNLPVSNELGDYDGFKVEGYIEFSVQGKNIVARIVRG